MIRNQFVSCIALRAIQFLLPSIVLLTVLTDSVNAQNVLSVPFSNGFVGDNTGNNSAGNCYYTNSLGFTNLQFVQNSTGTQFVEQGNDIVGSVVFYDAAGTYRSIPGFVKWRAPNGTVTTMVFRPSSATVTNVATNGSNGAATYPISSNKYIGLTFNGNTLTIGGSGNVTGNAATNGLLQELNTYLGNLPSITIVNVSVSENGGSAVVAVTLSESSGSVVTVQYNTSDSTATAGSDYTSTSGTLTFNAGQTTKTITIPIIDDVSVEFNEMFHIELYNSTNASIVDYQSLVTILDNEVAPVPGCTDSEACNYNASATQDNGTCTYPTQSYLNCAGTCINATDNDGVCNELEVPGCTDPTACNYNASATDNNNTCTYPTQSYLNCGGTCINDSDNDGICNELEIAGCTDPTACNYNSSATDNNNNNTCTYPAQTYLNCAGQCINDTDNDGVCNEDEVPGCTDPEACNYNILATDDNATCTYPAQTYLNCDGSCINDTDNDGICNELEVPGCTDPTACNYNADATDDNATCTNPTQTYLNCDGSCINDTDNDGICNELEVPGCTDPTACNFNAAATDDNATCTYPTQTYLNCDGSCINDSDNDGVCNEEEILGCTDPTACNFNVNATDENETCSYASLIFFVDNDGDGEGFGDALLFCSNPGAGYVNNDSDCNDMNAAMNTQSTEICDEVDNDCDGEVDEFVTTTYYLDSDGDGFGNVNETVEACELPEGYSENSDDCDDDLLTFEDFDEDGFGTDVIVPCGASNELDCDDTNPTVYAGATDICGNGIDEDCSNGDSVCVVTGCMDITACNFNPSANEDDASCIYPSQIYLNCDGSCINDSDNDGVCNENEVSGCTDPEACNYNSLATNDDATCTYPVQSYLNCDGSCINDTDNDGVCDEHEVLGCTDPEACNYNSLATDDDATCTYPAQSYLNCDGSCINDEDADGICNELEVLGCTHSDACNYNATATEEDESCTYPIQPYLNCDGSCINDEDNDGFCDENEYTGCTDPTACNYNPEATNEDGTCIYPTQSYLNCEGVCINDEDADGICTEVEGTDDIDNDGIPNNLDVDSDGDGIDDSIEGVLDADNDGHPNFLDLDSDGDDISDDIELTADMDEDGMPNYLDLDSDGDGILDEVEGNVDSDGDGTPNYLDLDSDGDGISDDIELTADMDEDGMSNYLDLDSDGDGILDETELTNDMDGDSAPNYLDVDSDGDGILDEVEGSVDSDGDGTPNYLDWDSDGDGISDETEGTIDSDGDGTPDYLDLDSDGDGILDETEGTTDTDGDGLPDYLDVDSDNDGVNDGDEVLGCTDASACDFNPLATESAACSYDAGELLIGEIQNASCGSGLGNVQVLNFENFTTFYLVEQDQEISATATINGLSDGQYAIVGKRTGSCISDTVIFVVGYNADCAPNAVNDTLLINEDAGMMQLNLVFNDSDSDNNLDPTTIDLDPSTPGLQTTSTGLEGDWSLDGNGILNFTPAQNYNGIATRLYVVSDASELTSNTAEIFIQVSPVNDAPNVVPASLEVAVDLNSTTTICLDATDIDGDAVNVSSWILMEGLGTINDNVADDYCFDFTATGWQIPTNVMVVMCDNGSPSLCDTAWITINVSPLKPIAIDDYITSNDGLVNIDVVLNDTLYGDNNFTITIIDSTDFGRVDLDTSLISYQPDWSYCGLDSMTYSVCNSFGMCDTATVYFEVTPIDSDLDGIPDYIETVTADIDGDGIFNHLDEDSDGDGLSDAEESGMTDLCSPTLSDCNGNGIPDYLDFNNCIPDLEIPEGFSPNGDGVNDTWVIPGIENYPGNTMVVFNRWGNQVYSAEPYDNSWNGECNESGTLGGNTLPEGTYFFIFKSERNATAKQGYIYIKR